jgi:hypothetical protein
MEDEVPLRLAYEAAIRSVTDQSGVLEGLRARAGTMFAATALVTSFLGGQALTRIERQGHLPTFHLVSVTGAAVLAFILVALATVAILWPYRVRFSVSASQTSMPSASGCSSGASGSLLCSSSEKLPHGS